MIIEAGAVLADVPRKFPLAVGHLQAQANGFHHILGHAPAAVWTVIARAVVGNLADHGDPGVDLPHVQAQIGVALVILQQDIVLGHIPLDQAALKNQRLKFRRRDNDVEMIDMADHEPCFRGMGSSGLKILRNTVFQFLCLADIDDLVIFIPHDVHAGGIGQAQRLVLELIKRHPDPSPFSKT